MLEEKEIEAEFLVGPRSRDSVQQSGPSGKAPAFYLPVSHGEARNVMRRPAGLDVPELAIVSAVFSEVAVGLHMLRG